MPSDEYSQDQDGGRGQVAQPTGSSAAGPPIVFRPRRWRVFVLMSGILLAISLCAVIPYAVHGWHGWHDSPLYFWCAFVLTQVGLQTWTAPRNYAVMVSDTEIDDGRWHFRGAHAIPLADLDRVRSAQRSPIDRLLGRQRFYSTGGKRIYLWRAAFDGSNFRELLDLLQVDQGNRS